MVGAATAALAGEDFASSVVAQLGARVNADSITVVGCGITAFPFFVYTCV